jgi:hypothetical protein
VAVSRREEALVGAGERGKLGVSRRKLHGKKDYPRGVGMKKNVWKNGVFGNGLLGFVIGADDGVFSDYVGVCW